MRKKIVLIHGYNKTSKDMIVLKNNLEKMDCDVCLVDLPLTYKSIDYCVDLFYKQIEKILYANGKYERISLVGHSTGGLIIRLFLQNTRWLSRIERCVLIATPNKGTQLADITIKMFKPVGKILKTLNDLTTENVEKLKIEVIPDIEIGSIAGNINNLLLGRLLRNDNDGRIEVDSAIIEGMKDSIVLPYGHKEIHYKYETSILINRFIRKGTFR